MATERMVWKSETDARFVLYRTVTDSAIPLHRQSYASIMEYPNECRTVISIKGRQTVKSTRRGIVYAKRFAEWYLIRNG